MPSGSPGSRGRSASGILTPMSNVPQQRLLQTAIPGPKSAGAPGPQDGRRVRRRRHRAAGLRRARRRRHPRRRRRQPAHRLRLRHRRDDRRQRRPARRRARCTEQVADFTHTCFMVTPYEEYVEVAEALNRADPRRPREAHRAVQLRRRGRRERRQGRPPRHRPRRRRRLRPRLPRPHQPHDGADRQEHALQAPASARSPARSTARRWPTRSAGRAAPSDCAEEAFDAFVIADRTTQVGEENVAAVIIEPIQGEGGFIVPAPGFLPQVADWCTRQRHPLHRRRDADRLLPHR